MCVYNCFLFEDAQQWPASRSTRYWFFFITYSGILIHFFHNFIYLRYTSRSCTYEVYFFISSFSFCYIYIFLIFFSILSKLDDSTLALIGHVNRHLRRLTKNDGLWRTILLEQMPSIIRALGLPSDRFRPLDQFDPSNPQDYGISPKGFRASYLFELFLLSIFCWYSFYNILHDNSSTIFFYFLYDLIFF